jgi:hypothetical protein
LFARIILTCASQHSALTLALSATHYFALEQPGDDQSARLSPETRAFFGSHGALQSKAKQSLEYDYL